MRFRKGMKVRLAVHVAGLVTYEDAVVLRVSRGEVWLDNGLGNDPSGPFDAATGRRDLFGGHQVISAQPTESEER